MGKYFLGLDIGTESIGWATTDTDYSVAKFKGKSMWGIRLFEERKTAAERRTNRCSKRRLHRRKDRVLLLEMLFNDEISKVDQGFYQRLKDSNLYLEDKSGDNKFAVFADSDYTDKDFHKSFPTIYHLRKELIESKNCKDVRLLFLALHHIIKHRGHFLFENLSIDEIKKFSSIYEDFKQYLQDNYDIELNCSDLDTMADIIKSREKSKSDKGKEIAKLCNVTQKTNKQLYKMLAAIAGSKVDLSDVFDDEALKNEKGKKIEFQFGSGFNDKKEETLAGILGERFELIEKLKAIYDWGILVNSIKGEEEYISFDKVKFYEDHKKDLTDLKRYVKKYANDKYSEIFKASKKGLNNYVAYSGHFKTNKKTGILEFKTNQEEFCKYLGKALGECKDAEYNSMFTKIQNETFMPKPIKDNSVIPMQVHRVELEKIIENAKENFNFLNNKDDSGSTVAEKILAIFDYKIPYYVGPLNSRSEFAWFKKRPERKNEKIYPWNFINVVDIDASAENFINRLTSKCTYLTKEDVMPKNSVLYSKYMVLNEINNLKVDGEKIDVSLKQDIYNDLFLERNKVTMSALKKYLKDVKGINNFTTISGIDGDFKSTMKSYRDFQQYNLPIEDVEEIIRIITVYGDDRRMLKNRLRKQFQERLSEDQVEKISKIKYKGWGRLSKKLLCDVYGINCNHETGDNIITALWETNQNFMELLYNENYGYKDAIDQENKMDKEKALKTIVDEMYISPNVKRPVYQSLQIVREIVKIQGQAPAKIFIEVAKGGEKNKKVKVSRKKQLEDKYKKAFKSNEELLQQLSNETEERLRSDKLFLYYSQQGKCMYCGKTISLDDLLYRDVYDIDHIYPQSKIKDDSIDNRVLVDRKCNLKKMDIYPLKAKTQENMRDHWEVLLSKGLISKTKFDRLVRTTPLTEDELSSFIARQLVETRQSTKAVAKILKEMYPDTEIVYVKAALANDFRKRYELYKSRDLNDYHHAKDAYLNIVVGNVYNEKVTHNKKNFIKDLAKDNGQGVSLNKIYDYDIKNAWVAKNMKSLETVKENYYRNDILYTRYAYIKHGGLFKQNLQKKGGGQVSRKMSAPLSDIDKYGGYNQPSSMYFAFVEFDENEGKRTKGLISIDAYKERFYRKNPEKYISELKSAKGKSYNNPKIIIPCVKYRSCLSFDGLRMHLGGKSSGGETIVYKPGIQLVLEQSLEKYVHVIGEQLKTDIRKAEDNSKISEEQNVELFDALINKMNNKLFKVLFENIAKKVLKGREDFINLSIDKQIYVLMEIIKILHHHNKKYYGDLRDIGGAGQSGIIALNNELSNIKNIKNIKKIKLINQSVTGLYENEQILIDNTKEE